LSDRLQFGDDHGVYLQYRDHHLDPMVGPDHLHFYPFGFQMHPPDAVLLIKTHLDVVDRTVEPWLAWKWEKPPTPRRSP
jgi:hypothetical protein